MRQGQGGSRKRRQAGSEGRHVGTGEQGRELALTYMWQIHMQTGPRMDAEAIAGTAHILCGRGLTPLSSQMLEVTQGCVSHYRSEGFNRGWKLIRIKKRTARACKRVGVTPLTAPSGRYTNWNFWPERANGWASPHSPHLVVAIPIGIFATWKRSGFVLQRMTKLKRRD